MTNCKNYEQFLLKAFSGELTEYEKEKLEKHIEHCSSCKNLYQAHLSLQQTTKSEDIKLPEAPLFNRMRENVLKQTTNLKKHDSFWIHNLKRLFEIPGVRLSPVVAFAISVMLLFMGYSGKSWIDGKAKQNANPLIANIQRVAAQNQTLLDVERSPYLFTNIRLQKNNRGQIALRFNVTTEAGYVGSPDDPLVQEIVSQALVNYSNDGTRLDAVALSGQMADPKIKEALIFSVLHDSNPAVRMKALDILGRMKMDEKIQAAIIKVLNNEKQVNMRLMAIDILAQRYSGTENIEMILRKKMQGDENPSVQIKAASYLQKIER